MGLERNLINVSNMSGASAHTRFHKDSCNMVRGVMVLMKGVQIVSMYKMLWNVDSTGCNNIISLEINLTGNRLESSEVGSNRLDKT